MLGVEEHCFAGGLKHGDAPFDHEEAFVARRTVSQNGLPLLVRFESHGLVALVDRHRVSLFLEIVEEGIIFEKYVDPFIFHRLFLYEVLLQVLQDFIRFNLRSRLILLLDPQLELGKGFIGLQVAHSVVVLLNAYRNGRILRFYDIMGTVLCHVASTHI